MIPKVMVPAKLMVLAGDVVEGEARQGKFQESIWGQKVTRLTARSRVDARE